MKHQFSIRPGCYGPHSMAAYEHVKEIGVEFLEVGIPDNPSLLKDMLADEDLGFKIGSFTFEVIADDPKIVDKFEKACAVCADFSYQYFFSSVKTKRKFGRNNAQCYKVLHQLGDIAERYGKFISMETHPPFCLNAAEMLKTMEGVNHKAVRINFDTANIYYYNKLKPGDGLLEMERVKPYIGSLHIKQTNGQYKGWYFPPLNDPKGVVDFKKVFASMDQIGFTGLYTLEIEGIAGDIHKITLEGAKKQVS